jgi:DUF1680 family protein
LVEKGLPAQFAQLEATDRLGNLRRCATNELGSQTGFWFNDSDVYKWLEACAYALAHHSSKPLKDQVDTAIEVVLAAQLPSGYINSYIQLNHPEMAFRNLGTAHEMYCGGHLIEAGVALFECLGDRRILDAGTKFVKHLMSIFGPDKRVGYCGHEEIELALIKLSATTNDPSYREFACWMLEQRGNTPSPLAAELAEPEVQAMFPGHRQMVEKDGKYLGEYLQDHAPIREHREVVGHAVRAMYLYTAAAQVSVSNIVADQALKQTLEAAWNNLTRKRMYVTGGVGPSRHNEGFTRDYDLPNLTAYAETCASCGLIFWGQAMLESTGAGEYADVIEQVLYNGALSGISLDTTRYFYDNPLESRGSHNRTSWFPCACCPPNIARLIANLGSYTLGVGNDSVWIHHFIGLEALVTINGVPVTIKIDSGFPWKGDVKISIDPLTPVEFDLRIRIPAWADDASTDLPGGDEAEYENGYAVFHKVWEPGDVLTVGFEIAPVWVEANPRVMDNLGRTALTRGPLVYCAEQVDNGFPPQNFSVDLEAELEEEWTPSLQGVMQVTAQGFRLLADDSDELYSPFGTTEEDDCSLKLIPYYAWANRPSKVEGQDAMQVWLRS